MSKSGPDAALIWDSLVAESQVAVELLVSGLRHLCGVPLPNDIFMGNVNDAKYPLHVGLHAFTSGFERLAKLTILLDGRLESGKFSTVRNYSHGLEDLYQKSMHIAEAKDYRDLTDVSFPDTSSGAFGALALSFLTEFASGPGRYSYLDSLSRGSRLSDPYVTWQELCNATTGLSAGARRNLWVHDEVESLIYGPGRDDLEVALGSMFENRPRALPASTATALQIYEFIPPVATLLSRMAEHAFYHLQVPGIPLLGEVVFPVTAQPEDFMAWELLHLGDVDVVVEVLAERAEADFADEDATDDGFADEDIIDEGLSEENAAG